jgi:hypothetical protein
MESNYVPLLESYWDFFYARHVLDGMNGIIKTKCTGCQNGYLSQREHSCLSLTKHEQLEMYFDDIVLGVHEEYVIMQWCLAVSQIDTFPQEVVSSYKLKLKCQDWRETDMKSEQWKKRIINMCVRLYYLENRF